jgi:pimeloyl-ACP methyl ester carboxylesterase
MLDGWASITIGGKSADVFAPPGSLPFALVYLHSLAEETPSTDPVFTLALKQHRLRCIAPRGGRCWWVDRICSPFDASITPERYLIDELVPWARAAWQLSERAIALAGVEMGGQGAVRLAFKYPDRFPITASISGAFDCQDWYGRGTQLDEMYENRERCRLDTAILHIDGHDWPPCVWFCCSPDDAWSYRGNDRLHEKLSAMGVPHAADLDTRAKSGTRYSEQMTPPMLAFIAEALAKESKRLV